MAGIGKDPVLFGQICPAAVHQIEAGQPVFRRDLLRADVLLDGFVVK